MRRAGWKHGIAGLALALPLAYAEENHVAVDPQAALTQYKCYLCHADRQAKAGPAFADVARHYRDDAHAVSRLAREIRRGIHGGGPWHMPPHPEVSANEARAIARYIMELDAGARSARGSDGD